MRPRHTGLPDRAAGRGRRARDRCHSVIDRFGYLQLDSVAVSGARTHAIVLASRLDRFDTELGEDLLKPGEPLFEYWGHEACWMPMEMYPVFAFRRRESRDHPWWGDLLKEHPRIVAEIMQRVERDGPFRSMDLDGGRSNRGGWDMKLSTRIAEALWSAGDLAIAKRRNFQRTFDLPERVIPGDVLALTMTDEDAFDRLLLKALDGHGWATTGTIAATWRLVNCRERIAGSLERLAEKGEILPCEVNGKGRTQPGWIRPAALDAVAELGQARLHRSRGVLLSPFDPVLWDRERVRLLFGFEQVLEIYKPASERRFGYYCLPVLAGDALIARVDLKADRKAGRLRVLACHYENGNRGGDASPRERSAVATALARFGASVGLDTDGAMSCKG